MFASDRDLLVLEPNLFRDVGWVGQRLARGTGAIGGTTLTISGADVALDAARVGPGMVAVVNGVAYEVLARLSASALTISRPRLSAGDPAQPPTPVAGVEAMIVTFGPQIGLVHQQLLRMLGIEPADAAARPGEADITNAAALTRLEALGALHLVYAAASGAGGPDSAAAQRAAMYRARFADERERAAARIDTDGDGAPDATRRFNVVQFVR